MSETPPRGVVLRGQSRSSVRPGRPRLTDLRSKSCSAVRPGADSRTARLRRVAAQSDRVGRLVSVNVGLPQDVVWQGRTVRTAVWKEPVVGPRMVRHLNVDGDGQGDLAGHGGEQRAVFVYQLESYRYWERELGRNDFVYGQFGENFTVDGLADDEVCVGDRYMICL